MPLAGYCRRCATYVWLTPEGGCLARGHGPDCISGVYESPAPAQAPVLTARRGEVTTAADPMGGSTSATDSVTKPAHSGSASRGSWGAIGLATCVIGAALMALGLVSFVASSLWLQNSHGGFNDFVGLFDQGYANQVSAYEFLRVASILPAALGLMGFVVGVVLLAGRGSATSS